MTSCCVKGCNSKHHAKGYCRKHYDQIKKFGKIMNTRYDDNEIILYDDYAEIILYNLKYEEVGRAVIDKEDVNKIKNYRWHLSKGRVVAKINKENVLLHRFIIDANDEDIVDHINRNPLNNRRNNLRKTDFQGNAMNRSIQNNNTSTVVGVNWYKRYSKWRAFIKINHKSIHLGYFEDFNEAVKVRKEAEQKYFGEFAPFN